MPQTIAIAHHAGGVGKTTTALNLGYSLARLGADVLLADLDPQADLTLRLCPDGKASDIPGALLNALPLQRHPLEWGDGTRIYLIPSNLTDMAGLELALVSAHLREFRLQWALKDFAAWDYILLDCPPALNLLTLNALFAADSVIVPVQAQDKALRQLTPILRSIADVQGYRATGAPQLGGLLLTMTEATRQTRQTEQELRASYPDHVFQTTIPRRIVAADDGRWQAPVGVYAPDSPVARAYTALAQEVQTYVQSPAARP